MVPINVPAVYSSIVKEGRSDKEVRYKFYSKLQAIVKKELQLPQSTNLVWPQEVFDYLGKMGHTPSSAKPSHGHAVDASMLSF